MEAGKDAESEVRSPDFALTKKQKKKKTNAKIKTVKLKAKKYELGAGHSGHKRQNKAQMWGTQIRIAEDKSHHMVVNEKPKTKKTRASVWWLLRLWVVGLSVPGLFGLSGFWLAGWVFRLRRLNFDLATTALSTTLTWRRKIVLC